MTDPRSFRLVGEELSTENRRRDGQSETAMPGIAALECRVGLGRVVVATAAIEIVAEYVVGAPLPLTEKISYSIGVWEDDIVLSMSLARVTDGGTRRTTTGLVLVAPGASVRWALEIVEPVGLVEITALGPPTEAARWLRPATIASGELLSFVDVRMLIADVDAPVRRRLDG